MTNKDKPKFVAKAIVIFALLLVIIILTLDLKHGNSLTDLISKTF